VKAISSPGFSRHSCSWRSCSWPCGYWEPWSPGSSNFKFSTDFRRPDWGQYVEEIAKILKTSIASRILTTTGIPSSWCQPIIFATENLEDSTIMVQGTDTVVQSYSGEIVDQVKIITYGRFVAIHHRTFNLSGSVATYQKITSPDPQSV
jgi:hypothetical protein